MQMIIAGSRGEAERAAKAFPRLAWKHIEADDDVRHLRRGSTVWLVGTYYERKDYDELAELCAARDIGLVRV